MKKKANGQYCTKITARGFLHEHGLHYFSHSTTAPVASKLTINIVLTITDFQAQVIDIKGAFLRVDSLMKKTCI
jgi:hypothetical protein